MTLHYGHAVRWIEKAPSALLRLLLAATLWACAGALHGVAFAAPDCAAIASAPAPAQTTILSAELVAADAAKPWRPANAPAAMRAVTVEFCRVVAAVRPTPGSDIRFEVWLPTRWNGKFFAAGSGGLVGAITYPPLVDPLTRGYAAMAHNNGHFSTGSDMTWALDKQTGKPDLDKVTDYAWRAQHLATVSAKGVASAYYSQAPAHSYYLGCSAGGHHGQMESQRFPEDFDGIAAGGGGADWASVMASEAWGANVVMRNNRAGGIAKSFLPTVAAHVTAACDKLDGAVDGQIEDPRRCKPDFTALKCIGVSTAACLTAPQIAAIQTLYTGARDPKTGKALGPSLMPGSETNWIGTWNAETQPGQPGAYFDYYRYLVHQRPDWSVADFNYVKDVARSRKLWDGVFAATDANLARFKARGGKLILYAGWSDGLMPPGQSLNYWARLQATMGAPAVDAFARLFMVPAGGHCGGGPLDQSKVDWLGALENWVEKGLAPDPGGASALLASGATPSGERRRVLCPYPQVARYTGRGDVNARESFQCAAP